MAITRPSWKTRGPLYTEYGIQIRCVRKDQTAVVSTNLTMKALKTPYAFHQPLPKNDTINNNKNDNNSSVTIAVIIIIIIIIFIITLNYYYDIIIIYKILTVSFCYQ